MLVKEYPMRDPRNCIGKADFMFEYDDASHKAAEELDKYDFTQILSDCYDGGMRDPWDIQHTGILSRYPELEDAMDNLSMDEFMEYLCRKYHVRFDEVISYRMWYSPLYK